MSTITNNKFRETTALRSEAGQAMLFALLGLGLFLLGAMALAIDMGNFWFSRQAAQTAADAACTAGAMDMLVSATNGSMPANANFTAGTKFDCNSTTTASPCSYAALNGFNSSLKQSDAQSGNLGNNVYVDFPAAKDVNLTNLNLPSFVTNPLIRVQIIHNIPTMFAGLLGFGKQGGGATSICAVLQASSPIPILVLNPTLPGTLSLGGGGGQKQTGNILIVGGPSKSIQVNSSSTTATSFSGGPTVNLCGGGGGFCGSNMGVWGSESEPSNFVTGCTTNNLCTATQRTPQWNSPSAPIADPYAGTAPPKQPTNTPAAPTSVAQGTAGCPDPGGCYEYQPGYYPNGICVGTGNCKLKTFNTAIFDPGIYYLAGTACKAQGGGSFCVESQACVRPSTAAGDGSRGTVFYMSDANSVNVGANAGGQGCANVTAFSVTTGTGTGQLQYGAACDKTSLTNLKALPSAVMPATLSGSVLLAPCQIPDTATYGTTLCDPNCSLNFGDSQGTNDPLGEQRGLLFFQNRTVNIGSKPGASWGGGGSMLLAGSMYFHFCKSGVSDAANLACDSSDFTDLFSLGGHSGSSTYVLGDIITDELSLQGNTAITMDLNPTTSFTTLKAALVQ